MSIGLLSVQIVCEDNTEADYQRNGISKKPDLNRKLDSLV